MWETQWRMCKTVQVFSHFSGYSMISRRNNCLFMKNSRVLPERKVLWKTRKNVGNSAIFSTFHVLNRAVSHIPALSVQDFSENCPPGAAIVLRLCIAAAFHNLWSTDDSGTCRLHIRKRKKRQSERTVSLDCVGIDLSSQSVARQVFSALMSLTSVFGMETGGPSSLKTPTKLYPGSVPPGWYTIRDSNPGHPD